MREPNLHEVKITDGFWKQREELNTRTAIFYQWEQLEATRCIDNFRIAAGLKQGFREGYFFADSDAYKWLDAACRLLPCFPDARLKKLVDDFIALLERAQQPDGYLFTYNQIHFPGQRWNNLQIEHELYCLGHLIEAAISHFEATSETRLLNVAKKAADLLIREMGEAAPDFTCGHEEIELALIKLWRLTGRLEYLALAKAFIVRRGTIKRFPLKMLRQSLSSTQRINKIARDRAEWLKTHPESSVFSLPAHNKHKQPFLAGLRFAISGLSGKYNQQDKPVIEQRKAEGHSVRFTYLKTAEAMLLQVTPEEHRIKLLREIWQQMVSRRMYVTGGIGSLPILEGFGRDFELDPEVAYAETCAALGCMLWNHEMANLTGEARFEDLYEWQLYNAASVGIGLDGCSYFYNNPLVSRGQASRAGWYSIPCCPSNLSRVWASMGKNICSYSDADIRVNQYISSEVTLGLNQPIKLCLHSELPWGNRVQLRFQMKEAFSTTLCLRLPAWTDGFTLTLNGKKVEAKISDPLPKMDAANGLDFNTARWIKVPSIFKPDDELEIHFNMPIRVLRQDKRVQGCGGQAAIARGPVVYCLESLDHSVDIFHVELRPESLVAEFDKNLMGGTWTIRGTSSSGLPLTFIPYMLWGNRGKGGMTVFVR